MADSAPDPKVEDVLSSVRRLVSGEIPRRNTRPSQPAGALVLTDAQRITEKPRPSGRTRSLEERIAELEAAVDRGNHEFEPDGSEDQSENVPDRIVYTRPPRDEQPSSISRISQRLSQISLIEKGGEDEDTAAPEAKAEFRHETSRIERMLDEDEDSTAEEDEAPMAEDVPQPTARGELHAFTNPDDVVARIEARMNTGGEPEKKSILALDMSRKGTPEMQQPLVLSSESKEFDDALSEAVAASLEPSGMREEGESSSRDFLDQDEVLAFVEPDTHTSEEDSDAPVEELADDDRDEAAAPVAEDEAPSSEVVAAALDALPEEEAMRLLVRRLMTEELKGELGERITRNVRKLVRREVMRALDSRDLM